MFVSSVYRLLRSNIFTFEQLNRSYTIPQEFFYQFLQKFMQT